MFSSKHMKIKAYGKVKEVNVIAEGETKYGNKLILAQVPFELDPRLTAFVIYQWHPTYEEYRHFGRFLASKGNIEEVERVKRRALEAFRKTAKNIKIYSNPPEKEHLPFLENAKRFYEEGVLRCPKCGSFRVTGEGTEERPYWCWACGYMWTKELFEPEVVRKAEKKEREMYAKMLAETLMYPFLKWEAEKHGFTGPDAVKKYLKWREEEDWRRNQFYGFYVGEGDQDYIERIVESYMEEPESYRGLDAIDAVLIEYGYDFADYRPHKGYIWNPLNKKWMSPPYPPRTGDEVLALPKYERMFPTHNYMFDRAIVKAVLLRRGWKFGIKGWQKG